MKKPLIGITTYVVPAKWSYWDIEAALVPADYVRAVERAGLRAGERRPIVEDVVGDVVAVRPDPELWIVTELVERKRVAIVRAGWIGCRRNGDAVIERTEENSEERIGNGELTHEPAIGQMVVQHDVRRLR